MSVRLIFDRGSDIFEDGETGLTYAAGGHSVDTPDERAAALIAGEVTPGLDFHEATAEEARAEDDAEKAAEDAARREAEAGEKTAQAEAEAAARRAAYYGVESVEEQQEAGVAEPAAPAAATENELRAGEKAGTDVQGDEKDTAPPGEDESPESDDKGKGQSTDRFPNHRI